MADRIAVGVIRKPHGVRGEASVELWSDSAERLATLKEVTLVSPDEKTSRAVTIESVRAHKERALVKFREFASPESLRDVHNWTVEVAEDQARKLDADEYYLHDLAGLTLIDAEGRERGVVVEAYEGGGGILLSVKRADGVTFDVPFAAGICTEIDLAQKRIVVEIPEGLENIDDVAD
jgi:16S rRNA processing protein RimM